jgi:hypothetical protein
MSGAMTPRRRRARQALAAAAAAGLLLIAGAASVWRDSAASAPPDVSGPVVAGWAEQAGEARRIEITGPSERFALVRGETGWSVPSRGDYPVRPERIADLDAALSRLQLDRAMTRDPGKFDRLGLGDPEAGGDGVRLLVLDSEGRTLASLIAGAERPDGTGLYVRRAGEARAFAAVGILPRLDDPGLWMGLSFWDIDPAAVARARITPERPPVWFVQRAGLAQRNHELMEPDGWSLITGGAANGVATAGARLRFRDVRRADTLTGAFAASHAAVTFSGLAYRFDFIAEGEERWALVTVEAVADDAGERAQRLTALTEGWAFKVSDDAYERLTRPLDQVAERSSAR